jgi:hypothetical protein
MAVIIVFILVHVSIMGAGPFHDGLLPNVGVVWVAVGKHRVTFLAWRLAIQTDFF